MKTLPFWVVRSVVFMFLTWPIRATIFYDDFEAGLGNWLVSPTPAETMYLSTDGVVYFPHNIVPSDGRDSAFMNLSWEQMYHNLSAETTGYARASWYIFDQTVTATATRAFGQVAANSGDGFQSGTLQNLISIGINTGVSMPGETFDLTKYQGRVLAGANSGWFNLNGAGVPSRTTGWHRFDIERLADGTTYNFYVDGLLGRTITGVADFAWDSITIGGEPVPSWALCEAWFDGVEVTTVVPEPSAAAVAFAFLALATGLIGRRFRK